MTGTAVLDLRVALVGPGRAGRAFARSWSAAGGRIATTIGRGPRERSYPSCDVAVLAVPDDAIAGVAAELAPRLPCRFALHLSGAVGSEALGPFISEGAAAASVHPVRPFTGAPDEDWRGAFVAIEGQAPAVELAEAVVTAIGANPHRLAADNRALYHACATLAAGGAAAVVSIAVRGWVAAGIPEDVARQTLSGLAARATAALGTRRFPEAFTGAVARRDAGTVRAHIDALREDARSLALYRALAEEILRRTEGAGREDEIRALLG